MGHLERNAPSGKGWTLGGQSPTGVGESLVLPPLGPEGSSSRSEAGTVPGGARLLVGSAWWSDVWPPGRCSETGVPVPKPAFVPEAQYPHRLAKKQRLGSRIPTWKGVSLSLCG